MYPKRKRRTLRLWYFSKLDQQLSKANRKVIAAHKEIVEQKVILEAQTLAEKNLPHPDEPSMEPYLDTVKGSYRSIQKEISIELKGGLQKILGTTTVGTINESIEDTKTQIKEETEKRNNLEIDRRRIHIKREYKLYMKQQWLLVLFAIGECSWTIMAFITIGEIVLSAIALGSVIGLAQVILVKLMTQIFREIQNPVKRRVYAALGSIFLLLFSLSIALLRYWFVHNGQGNNIPFLVMNPFTFTGINLLIIAATAFIIYYYYPDREDLKKIKERKRISSAIEKSEKKINRWKNEIDELVEEKNVHIQVHAKTAFGEKKTLELVDERYEESVGIFKHENVVKRKDGKYPISFKNHHAPLRDAEFFEKLLD